MKNIYYALSMVAKIVTKVTKIVTKVTEIIIRPIQ